MTVISSDSRTVWGSYGSQDVGSEHPVGLLMAQDLHQAVGVCVGLGSAVRCKRKLANFVRNALRTTANT